MKRFFLFLFCLAALSLVANAETQPKHSQYLHQYIVREGYNLLKLQLGEDIPGLAVHIGSTETSGPWTTGAVVAGAYREDEEDVVYHYCSSNPPNCTGGSTLVSILTSLLPQDPFVSTTHFWNPDDGDATDSQLDGSVSPVGIGNICFTVRTQNAYQKMLAYKAGYYLIEMNPSGWPLMTSVVGSQFNFYNTIGQIVAFKFHYEDLVSFYKTGIVVCDNNTQVIGVGHGWVNPYGVHFVLPRVTVDQITWEVLGRMSHLLGDMSVAAHVHNDMHGSDEPGIHQDTFEQFMCSQGNWDWNGQSVYNSYHNLLDPYQSSNPLHFLMYTTAQIAGYFGTNGPYGGEGNSVNGGNPLPEEISYTTPVMQNFVSTIDGINITTMHASCDQFTTNRLNYQRDKTIPQVIRAEAGLLYWFAKEVGLYPVDKPQNLVAGLIRVPTKGVSPQWYLHLSWNYANTAGLTGYEGQWKIGPNQDWTTFYDNISPNAIGCTVFGNSFGYGVTIRARIRAKHGSVYTPWSNETSVTTPAAPPPGGGQDPRELQAIGLFGSPDKSMLLQNAPNPMRDQTTIGYQTAAPGNVSLTVYNIRGQAVRELVNGSQQSGPHYVSWDGKDKDGNKVSAGVYIYQIKAGRFSATRKTTILQ